MKPIYTPVPVRVFIIRAAYCVVVSVVVPSNLPGVIIKNNLETSRVSLCLISVRLIFVILIFSRRKHLFMMLGFGNNVLVTLTGIRSS